MKSHNGPTPESIYQAYLSKYPPTEKFTGEDLDPGRFIKANIADLFEAIRDLDEKERHAWKKADKYIGARQQCQAEIVIRCQSGMFADEKQIDCPVAKITDHGEREEGWDRLEADVSKLPAALDKIDWDNPRTRGMAYYRRMRRSEIDLIHALGMDADDLEDVPADMYPLYVPGIE